MPALVFNLMIQPDEYQRMYAGAVKNVRARSVDGRRVHFPANILRPFVTREGIKGRFMINFDDNYKFESIQRLA